MFGALDNKPPFALQTHNRQKHDNAMIAVPVHCNSTLVAAGTARYDNFIAPLVTRDALGLRALQSPSTSRSFLLSFAKAWGF